MKNNTTVVYTPVESSKLGVESAILLRGHEAYRCIWGILLYSIEEE